MCQHQAFAFNGQILQTHECTHTSVKKYLFFFFFLQEVVFRLLDLMFCAVRNLTFALLCRNMFYDARGEKSETIFAVSKDLCFTIVICAFVSIILLIQNHTWICFALFPNENR